jgi:Domain of unknown function (DUF4913)
MTTPRTDPGTSDRVASADDGPAASSSGAATGLKPQFDTVEAWVRDYLLPSFPRPAGELGAGGRWRWCEEWWRHDEAVTILTALWYGWEHAAVQPTGMLDWLPRLYYMYPILSGDDGPFRLCAPAGGDVVARHEMPNVADIVPAPPGWWQWWTGDTSGKT